MIYFFVNNLQSYSGAALQALNLSKYLSQDVVFINSTSKVTASSKMPKNVVNLNKNLIIRFFKLLYIFARRDVRLIHFHGHFFMPMIIAIIFRKPFLIKTTLMGVDDFHSLLNGRYGMIRLLCSRKSKCNIVLSEAMMRINRSLAAKLEIKLIPNGVKIPDKCIALGQKSNTFYTCGVVSKRKKTLDSIIYFHRNFSRLKDSRFYVIGPIEEYGDENDFDPVYVKSCFEYVDSNELKNKVIFTGLLSQDKVFEIAMASKALIFLSEAEGMPNVVLEAMAMNCVPIISDMDGVAEEMLGFELVNIINRHNLNIDLVDEIIVRQMPFLRVKENFSFELTAAKYEEIYRTILQ